MNVLALQGFLYLIVNNLLSHTHTTKGEHPSSVESLAGCGGDGAQGEGGGRRR